MASNRWMFGVAWRIFIYCSVVYLATREAPGLGFAWIIIFMHIGCDNIIHYLKQEATDGTE